MVRVGQGREVIFLSKLIDIHMSLNWNGVFPALTTKFTAHDTLDLPMFGTNLDAQVNAGINGVIIGGSLGEASTLQLDEKEALVKYAVERIGKKVPVLLNIAEGSTREAIRQAALATRWGAHGLMLLPPMRYRSDHRETVTYFRTVAESTDLPIMIYNNPVDYKIEVTLQMFEELSDLPNIESVKESTRDVSNVTRMINRFGDRYKVLCGVDTIAMEELLMGACGLVGGLVCAFPAEDGIQLGEAGDWHDRPLPRQAQPGARQIAWSPERAILKTLYLASNILSGSSQIKWQLPSKIHEDLYRVHDIAAIEMVGS